MMKLVIAIIDNSHLKKLIKELIVNHYYVTKIASTGGFLMKGNTTLLIGCREEELELLYKLIEENAKSNKKVIPSADLAAITTLGALEVNISGAVVFVLNVEQFNKF